MQRLQRTYACVRERDGVASPELDAFGAGKRGLHLQSLRHRRSAVRQRKLRPAG